MGSVSDWLDLMPATVTYEAVLTRDEYGKPATYDTAVDYRARVTYKHQRVPSRATGQDVIASIQVWLNGAISTVKVDDRVTLPDGTTPLIVSWDLVSDETGNHHTKLYMN